MKTFCVVFVIVSSLVSTLVEGTPVLDDCLSRIDEELTKTDLPPLRLETLKVIKRQIEKLNAIAGKSDEIISKAISTLETHQDIPEEVLKVISSADIFAEDFRRTGQWNGQVADLIEKTSVTKYGQEYLQCRTEPRISSFKAVVDLALIEPETGDIGEEDAINIVRKVIAAYARDFEKEMDAQIECFLSVLGLEKIAFVEKDEPTGIWKELDISKMQSSFYSTNIKSNILTGSLNIITFDTKSAKMAAALKYQSTLALMLTLAYREDFPLMVTDYFGGDIKNPSALAKEVNDEFTKCIRNPSKKSIVFDNLYQFRENSEKKPSFNVMFLAGLADIRATNVFILDCFIDAQNQFSKTYTNPLLKEDLVKRLSTWNNDDKLEVSNEVNQRLEDVKEGLQDCFVAKHKSE